MKIRQAALEAAKQMLETERTIVLSKRDALKVFDLLKNPPAPNQQILAAIEKHRVFIRENHRAAE
ncbi:DUF1778 domain-containing protein [Chamaesiphon minutus]|uniref:type II toxin-antitoxin system TacA family antitoxin n=1 Tax=Chamaesiphon minutus TaxID=1173032 RepID=UPI000300D9D3|nr:DUF1778 domain-containing protein [Chamaesiphon minutus]